MRDTDALCGKREAVLKDAIVDGFGAMAHTMILTSSDRYLPESHDASSIYLLDRWRGWCPCTAIILPPAQLRSKFCSVALATDGQPKIGSLLCRRKFSTSFLLVFAAGVIHNSCIMQTSSGLKHDMAAKVRASLHMASFSVGSWLISSYSRAHAQ